MKAGRRRIPIFLYVALGVGALVFVGLVLLFTLTGAGNAASASFAQNFLWAYSAERHALQGSGCHAPSVVPRLDRNVLQKSGVDEARLDRLCDSDGYCGTEIVQCHIIEKAPVACDAVAEIHRRYGKPKRVFTVKALFMPSFKTHCHALYGSDAKLLHDLHERDSHE